MHTSTTPPPFGRVAGLLPALICCTLVSGCMGPVARTPAPFEMPERFSSSGEVDAEPRWWESFQAPRLNALVERALCDNFSLHAAAAKVAELEAMARAAGAPLLPALTGNGDTGSRRNIKRNTTARSFSLGVAASWEVDLWGRLQADREAATAHLLAGEEEMAAAALSIAAEVADTWFARLENEGQQQLLSRQRQTNSRNLELIDVQVLAGKAGIADLLQQQQLVEANDTTLEELRAEAAVLDHRLSLLLGLPPGSPELATGELPELPPLPTTGIPLALIQRRPDVRAAFTTLAAADAEAAAATAARFPALSITAGGNTTAESTAGLFNTWLTSVAAGLTAPIVDGGRLRAAADRKHAAARRCFHLYGQSVLEALMEVENALKNEEALVRQLGRLKRQFQLAKNSVEHINRRYRQGSLGYQRVLSASLTAQGLQRQILHLRLQLLSNRITLYRALSGGLPAELLPAADDDKGSPQIRPFAYSRRQRP